MSDCDAMPESNNGVHRIVGVGGFTGVAASNAKPFVCVVPTATTSNGETCQPKSSLIYVKTHKTGSSTLSNIFHRYAFGHGLRVPSIQALS